jgi:hypothetical protein
MIWFAAPPQAVAVMPVADLQISKSLGWQLMPFALRFMVLTKCGVAEDPEQFVIVFATA